MDNAFLAGPRTASLAMTVSSARGATSARGVSAYQARRAYVVPIRLATRTGTSAAAMDASSTAIALPSARSIPPIHAKFASLRRVRRAIRQTLAHLVVMVQASVRVRIHATPKVNAQPTIQRRVRCAASCRMRRNVMLRTLAMAAATAYFASLAMAIPATTACSARREISAKGANACQERHGTVEPTRPVSKPLTNVAVMAV